MDKKSRRIDLKRDHLRINTERDVQSGLTNGLERIILEHQALPELDFSRIDIQAELFSKTLHAPVFISSMTGGIPESIEINRILAEAAQIAGIAMGVGSQRAALEFPDLMETFKVRKYAPDILLFANLGAVQLNYSFGPDQCRKAVEAIEADALILHLNPIQEALQLDGNTNFSGLLKKIEMVCKNLHVPVVVKEVGWGISERVARHLISAGVAAIDVAGAGGTSWSEVEKYRLEDPQDYKVAEPFKNWGISTVQSIHNVRKASPDVLVFASGGLRTGVDIAKCIALGASLCGMAGVFLRAVTISLDELQKTIWRIIQQLKISMFAAGASDLNSLRRVRIIEK
ncbi:MAG TPA: type 2 isopentenyl-diphosphate Delta-isomerase [Anaerolineae bacterium]|nr:type 2 isopentenyl-diphosphate Delta-isomerase [Anaerolineae bacterium]